MLSLELFAGLLSKLPANCSLVLVGDPNQLSSVGTGNLIPELLELGCPVTRLERQYRQSDNESALFYNVVNYPKLSDSEELKFDDSFQLIPASEGDIFKVIQEEAVKRYLAGENVQVIATTRADVKKLNEALQQVVNPPAEGKAEVTHNGITVRENDRTMILKNNREERCFNGDIGTAHVEPMEGGSAFIHIPLSANRQPKFFSAKIGSTLALAYALTVHKVRAASMIRSLCLPAQTVKKCFGAIFSTQQSLVQKSRSSLLEVRRRSTLQWSRHRSRARVCWSSRRTRRCTLPHELQISCY